MHGYLRRQYFSKDLSEFTEPLNNLEKRILYRAISKGPEAEVSLLVVKCDKSKIHEMKEIGNQDITIIMF